MSHPLKLAGLEPLNIDDDALFVNVGERTNVTGSRAFAKLVLTGDFSGAVEVARQQVQNGAQFLHHARLVRRYGAAAIVMAFDEKGQADTFERKVEICQRAYDLLTQQVGFPAEDIIFDPNIFAIATGIDEHNNYAVDFINATRWIKQHLPHAKISGGVSNVSFSFRGNDAVREAIHTVFLYHAIRAGMTMGIVNAGQLGVYDELNPELRELAEDVVLNRRPDATERLVTFAETYRAKGKASVED